MRILISNVFIFEIKSFHFSFQYKDSAWIFAGGLPYDLTEGDIICVFSQYGEIVHINLVRDQKTGKSKGFAFVCYEDQRSTILAVDNLNGMKLLGRLVRVDHVHTYKLPKDLEKMDADRRKLFMEGCAPKPLEAQISEDENSDELLPMEEKETKKKKKKKEKKKKSKKKKHSSSDSSSNSESEEEERTKKSSKNVEKYRRNDRRSRSRSRSPDRKRPRDDRYRDERQRDRNYHKGRSDYRRSRSRSRDRDRNSRSHHRRRSSSWNFRENAIKCKNELT